MDKMSWRGRERVEIEKELAGWGKKGNCKKEEF